MSVFERIAYQVAERYAPKLKVPDKVLKHLPVARELLAGNFEGAVDRALGNVLGFDFGVRPRFGQLFGAALANPSPLLGGISAYEAEAIYKQVAGTDWAKKNLWHLAIYDLSPSGIDRPDANLFATDVGYAPFTINGNPVVVGSGSFDTVQGRAPVEIRITTRDDSRGTLKKWFQNRVIRMCRPDGTFGLPIDYLMRVDITHAYISPGVQGASNAHVDSYIVRPGALEVENSRRDDNLQELQLSLVEFDTFNNLV